MNRILLFFCFSTVLFSNIVLGQTDSTNKKNWVVNPKNELFLDVTRALNISGSGNGTGILYRRHYGDWAFRARLDFTISNSTPDGKESQYNRDSFWNPTDSMGYQVDVDRKYKLFSITPKIGFQWGKTVGKFQFYLGTDLVFSYQKNSRISIEEGYSNQNNFNQITLIKNNFTFKNDFWSIGVSPFVGLRFRPLKNLSLGLEYALNAYYSEQKILDMFVSQSTTDNRTSVRTVSRSSEPKDWGLNLDPWRSLTFYIGFLF